MCRRTAAAFTLSTDGCCATHRQIEQRSFPDVVEVIGGLLIARRFDQSDDGDAVTSVLSAGEAAMTLRARHTLVMR